MSTAKPAAAQESSLPAGVHPYFSPPRTQSSQQPQGYQIRISKHVLSTVERILNPKQARNLKKFQSSKHNVSKIWDCDPSASAGMIIQKSCCTSSSKQIVQNRHDDEGQDAGDENAAYRGDADAVAQFRPDAPA